jgi:YD repeat-containing protein
VSALVRALCPLICCALLLQPSAIVAGRGASRAATGTHATGSHGLSPSASAALSLLAVYEVVAGGLRALAGALPSRRYASAASEGFNATAEGVGATEPAAVFLGAPTLSVDTTSDTSVSLSWTQVSGALTYRVERTPNLLTPFSLVTETANNAFGDTDVSRGRTFLYRVRAMDGSGAQSAPSAVVMATAITFLDETITAHVTVVKWQHVDDLRVAVTGVRRAALLPDPSWTYAVAHGVPVRAKDVQELRDSLNEGLQALGLPTPDFTNPILHTGENGSTPTPISKIHFDELRARARSGSGVTGSGLSAYDFASARLDASNRTGSAGVDLVSRNFNWSLPLVGLPGRSGLDLGLSLSYNSLVWTKSGNYVLFDGDGGWPSPGFRLGFPVVQGKFADTQAGKSAYLFITPSGARVSLRQTAAGSTVYESGDSSYLQLRENQDGTLALLTTDGTRMTYLAEGGVYKCASVEDSNGNLINVAYNASGNVSTVTDTLGRVLTFNYDGTGYLQSITQTWHREVESVGQPQVVTETHNWARFTYADKTVRTNFAGLTVFGPSNGQTIHALTGVQLSDDSSYAFDYTTWGQVNKVTELSPDGHALSSVSLNLPADETAAQGDCPRFTESGVWAAYWNGDADGSPASDGSEDAVTAYGPYNFAGGVGHADAPDLTRHQETYETSGYKKGLTTQADEFSSDDYQNAKKSTVLTWTQDDETLPYQQNPRVRQTDIYDSFGNHRRTDVAYTSFGLPTDVKEYDSTAQVVLRRTHTVYLPGSITPLGTYVNPAANPALRIIGLPSERDVYGTEGGQEKLYSKLTYDYDLPNDNTTQFLSDAGAVAQHDSTYGQGFTLRGNVCRARKWDVTDAQNTSKAIVASEAGYNTLGSVVFTRDALLHTTTFAYADSDGGARLAYPTNVTDPDNFSSTAQYNYDLGVATRVVDPKGAAVRSFYDAAGRKLRAESEFNGAYAAWEYGTNGRYVKQFTKVDTDKTETFVMSVTDGAGRGIGVLREHPNSATGYAAGRSEYDRMGQLMKQYSPVEVSVDANNLSDTGLWVPAGDDAKPNGRADWPYTQQTYDWKGRPKETTNPDGTKRDVDYSGCGCAGGEVVTTYGELVPIPGTNSTGRRTQKVYSDSLGRRWKIEVLNWDGSVYSTTETTFNALDQATLVRQFQGSDQSGVFQDTTASYDVYGRPKTKHTPGQQVDQNNSSSTDHTTWDYNADGTVQKVTDARGATTTYTLYNNRGLPLNVSYGAPAGSNIGVPPSLTLTYDEAGNRTSMTQKDGSGNVVGGCTYHYDTLSRLTSEDRQFPGLTGTYTLSYEYTLSGVLKKLTDPAGDSISYGYDQVGRLTGVTGSPFANATTYASGITYRAWGAPKSITYDGDSGSATTTYDTRMRPQQYTLSVPATQANFNTGTSMREQFQYYGDGRLQQMTDLDDHSATPGYPDTERRFSRRYSYDHVGRLTSATGVGATGQSNSLPFSQSFVYDEFDHPVQRSGSYYYEGFTQDAATFQNGRRQDWTYDADGRVVHSPITATGNGTTGARDWTYDAAGRLTQARDTLTKNNTTTTSTYVSAYDGDGLSLGNYSPGNPTTSNYYMVRSTVLGGSVVTSLDSAGNKTRTTVKVDGLLTAMQNPGMVIGGTFVPPSITWQHRDPAGLSEVGNGSGDRKGVYDPLGNYVSFQTPPIPPAGYNPLYSPSPSGGFGSGFGFNGGSSNVTCTLNGLPTDCNAAVHALIIGAADPCPNNDCGPQMVDGKLQPLTTDPETGRLGYRKRWVDGHDTDPTGNPGGSSTTTGPDGEEIIRINHNAVAGYWEYEDAGGDADFFATVFDPQGKSPCVFQINIGKSDLSAKDLEAVKYGIQYIFEQAGLGVKFDTSEGATSDTGPYTLNIVNKYPKAIPDLDGSMHAVTDVEQKQALGITRAGQTTTGQWIVDNKGYVSIGAQKSLFGSKGVNIGLGRSGAHEAGRYFLQYASNANEITPGIMGGANRDYTDPNADASYRFTVDEVKILRSHCH